MSSHRIGSAKQLLACLGLVLGSLALTAIPASAGSGSGSAGGCNHSVGLKDGPWRSSVFGSVIAYETYYFQFCYNGTSVTSTRVLASNWLVDNRVPATTINVKNARVTTAPYFVSWNGHSHGAMKFRVDADLEQCVIRYGCTGHTHVYRIVTIYANGRYSWTGWGG